MPCGQLFEDVIRFGGRLPREGRRETWAEGENRQRWVLRPVSWVRCYHCTVQGQGRQKVQSAGSMEPLVDVVGPRAASSGGPGNPEESLLSLGVS